MKKWSAVYLRKSVIDGVNVPNEVYTIETEISKNGDVVKEVGS
jgi:type I site-specific restriction endonuclease